MIYYGEPYFELFSYEATDKARNDTCKILNSMGYSPLKLSCFSGVNIEKADEELANIEENDIILLQYPTYSGADYEKRLIEISHKKKAKIGAIVHDLESIRFYGNDSDIEILNGFDIISLPSMEMYKKLLKQGLKTKVKIQLIWDFLAMDNQQWYDTNSDIVFAGNLTMEKSKWIMDVDFPMLVYGDNINNLTFNDGVKYCGKKHDSDLVKEIGGQIGLLWEEGLYKNYLKYNLSFKPSLYLAANCPIIVPAKTHIGNIVETYKIGVTVKNIERQTMLDAVIKLKDNLNFYQERVSTFGETIRNGQNMKTLVESMVREIEN